MTSIGPGRPAPTSNALLSGGTSLFFTGANAIYWQVRPEKDGRGRADRLLAIYKEKAGNLDPVLLDGDPSNDHLTTTQWRLPPVSRPEDMLIGVYYLMDPVDGDIIVSDASHWAFAGTGLVNGSRLPGLLGYEVDGVWRKRAGRSESSRCLPGQKSGTSKQNGCFEHGGLCRSFASRSLCDWKHSVELGTGRLQRAEAAHLTAEPRRRANHP